MTKCPEQNEKTHSIMRQAFAIAVISSGWVAHPGVQLRCGALTCSTHGWFLCWDCGWWRRGGYSRSVVWQPTHPL